MQGILLTTTIVTLQAKRKHQMLIVQATKPQYIQINKVVKIKEYQVVNIEKKLEEVNSEKDLTDKSLRTSVMLSKEIQERFVKISIKTPTTTQPIEVPSQLIIIKGHPCHIQDKK